MKKPATPGKKKKKDEGRIAEKVKKGGEKYHGPECRGEVRGTWRKPQRRNGDVAKTSQGQIPTKRGEIKINASMQWSPKKPGPQDPLRNDRRFGKKRRRLRGEGGINSYYLGEKGDREETATTKRTEHRARETIQNHAVKIRELIKGKGGYPQPAKALSAHSKRSTRADARTWPP